MMVLAVAVAAGKETKFADVRWMEEGDEEEDTETLQSSSPPGRRRRRAPEVAPAPKSKEKAKVTMPSSGSSLISMIGV